MTPYAKTHQQKDEFNAINLRCILTAHTHFRGFAPSIPDLYINVTKPYRTLIRLHVTKSALLKCSFPPDTYLQYYPSPICPSVTPRSSTFSPSHLLFFRSPSSTPSPHSTHPSFPTLSLSLFSLPHSPLAFFLSTPLNLY